MEINITKCGAVGDGRTKNTGAFAQAIAACVEAGGGTVHVPPGTFLTGPVWLKSHITLYLEPGAIILGSPEIGDYGEEDGLWYDHKHREGLISARDAENVTITGRGTIDGNGPSYVAKAETHNPLDYDAARIRQGDDFLHPRFGTDTGVLKPDAQRPGNLVRFLDCQNVRVSGVTIANAPSWTMNFRRCENVLLHAITVHSRASDCRVPNDDGMDFVACDSVRISDCLIDTGDDCIAIFGGDGFVVSGCHLQSKSSAIRLGYDYGARDLRNVVIDNATIHANRAVVINVRGANSVENVLFSNLTIETHLVSGHWWGKGEIANISAMPLNEGDERLGRIKNVHFQNILAEGESGIVIYGSEPSVIEDVTLQDVRLRIKDGPLQECCGGNFDFRAVLNKAEAMFAHDIPAIFCRHIKGLTVQNCRVGWSESVPPFFSHVLECDQYEDIVIDGLHGQPAHPGDRVLALHEGEGVTIRDCTSL